MELIPIFSVVSTEVIDFSLFSSSQALQEDSVGKSLVSVSADSIPVVVKKVQQSSWRRRTLSFRLALGRREHVPGVGLGVGGGDMCPPLVNDL